MHIKKQDIMSSLTNIQKKDNEQLIDQEKIPFYKKFQGKIEKQVNYENLGIDRLRGQVLNLHDELKSIQTEISGKQIQVSFLKDLPDNENWKQKLESFMKEQFSESIVIKPDPDLKTYLNQLMVDLKMLHNDTMTREIKLENILSSGIIDAEKSDVSDIIIKDMDKAKEVFSRIKKDSISRILKS
jgi:parvulin-like peptidyl-prolyl isomerase